VSADKNSNGAHQNWKVVYVEEETYVVRRGEIGGKYGLRAGQPFFLMSKLSTGRVIDSLSGGTVTLENWSRGKASQQFFFDAKTRTIKSMQWKNKSLQISDNGKGHNLTLAKTTARWWQMWYFKNNQVVSERQLVWNIKDEKDDRGVKIDIAKSSPGAASQSWTIMYLDSLPTELRQGELNKDFGLLIGRPFHIKSKTQGGRYIDIPAYGGRQDQGSLVIKIPNGQIT